MKISQAPSMHDIQLLTENSFALMFPAQAGLITALEKKYGEEKE